MRKLQVLLLSILSLTLYSGLAEAAEYSCEIKSDFRIRSGSNINQITDTRLSGTQVCVGEPVVRQFKKADGKIGTDTFRQVRLPNGQLAWVSAKGVTQAQPIRAAVAPVFPRPRPANLYAPQAAAPVVQPVSPVVQPTVTPTPTPSTPRTATASTAFYIDDGFRMRSSPNDSGTGNVVGLTKTNSSITPVYSNGNIQKENGFFRATDGQQEFWVHESALKTVPLPQMRPKQFTSEILANLPRVDPNLQRAADALEAKKAEEARRAHNEALLATVPKIDPELKRAADALEAKKAEEARRAHNEALLQGLPQVDAQMQRLLDAQAKKTAEQKALQEALEKEAARRREALALNPTVVTTPANQTPAPPISTNNSLQEALNRKADQMKTYIEQGGNASEAVAATNSNYVPPQPEIVTASIPTPEPVTTDVNGIVSVDNNYLVKLSERSWLRNHKVLQAYANPSAEGQSPQAEIARGARLAILEIKWLYPEDFRNKQAWFKVVPFECTRINYIADPNMKPDDLCNTAYWVKYTDTTWGGATLPTAEEFASRPTPESYTEAGGVCENCNEPVLKADLLGDEIKARAN